MTSRIGARRSLLIAAALAILCAFPTTALAHAEVVRAIPADGATVTEPVSVVSARYSEDLTSVSSLKVLDAGGAIVATGAVDPDDDRRMLARPDAPLTNGTFTVQSTAASTDGHIERVEWAFSVQIPATAAPTATPTPASTGASAPPTASPTPAATPSPAASASPTSSADPGTPTSSTTDVLLPIIAALVVVLIGAGFLLRRDRAGR
jgi:methionine-rich copper-binding protein CopC